MLKQKQKERIKMEDIFLSFNPEKSTAVNQVICCSKGKKEMFGMSQIQKE